MVQGGHPGACRLSLCSSCSATAFFNTEGLSERPLFVSILWAERLFPGGLIGSFLRCDFGHCRVRNNQEERWVMQGLWYLADSFLPQSAAELDPSGKMKGETPWMPPSCPWCLPENNRSDSLKSEPDGFYSCVQKLNEF